MSDGRTDDRLDRLAVAAGVVFVALIVLLVVGAASRLTPNIDLGVFGTLMGGLLAILGRGAVVRLFGGPK